MSSTKEIDLKKIFQLVFKNKKTIVKTIVFFSLIGIIISLTIPNTYKSYTIFIPQLKSESKPSSSISSLASLAGINFSSLGSENSIPPNLYPQIINSPDYNLNLLNSKIKPSDKEITIRKYLKDIISKKNLFTYIKEYTIGLPKKATNFFKNIFTKSKNENSASSKEIYKISEEDSKLFDFLDNKLNLSINQKEGFITISYLNENKFIGALIVQNAQILLQNKIIEFKIKTSKENLRFTSEQYQIKKLEYENLQDQLAVFNDKNMNISNSLFQNKYDRIKSELSIYEKIVTQLASEVEQAKLQVNKDTPVFTIIDPVSIPFKKHGPNRTFIVSIFIILGIFYSLFNLFLKEDFLKYFKNIVK